MADRWLGSAWSPDGASIVALEGRPGPNGATFAIVRMDPTGTVVQQTPFDHRFTGLFPELVGPDGSELLFSSGPSGCTMQPFDLVSFTLGAALPLPRDLCSGQYDWDQAVPGVVWAAEQRERVLHRLDGTTGVDTPIPLDGVVGPEYQITWLVLYGGAVYVSFIPNPESSTGADGVPLPDLVVRVDQATLVPEAPREMDGRVGATGGKMVLLGSDGIVAELDPAMLEPIDDATATTRPPVAWGVLQVDETLAWTADQHGDALQILQRNPDTSRVVASGQTLSGFGEQLFVSVWRFAIGRDLYVLLSDDQGGVASRMWRVAPAADAALVPDVQIADAATDGATSSTTTSTTTPPAPGADALTAERLADVPGSIQVAASPDGASLIAVTRDWTQTGSPSAAADRRCRCCHPQCAAGDVDIGVAGGRHAIRHVAPGPVRRLHERRLDLSAAAARHGERGTRHFGDLPSQQELRCGRVRPPVTGCATVVDAVRFRP